MSENGNEQNPAELEDLKKQLDEALKGIEALKAKNDELIAEKREAQRKAKEREEAAAQAAAEAAAKAGDVEALNKSWEAKLAKREAELTEALKARDSQLMDLTVGATAQRLASELAVPGSADVLLPHIKSRLRYEDGKTVVLDTEGKPSASTVDELANEIRNDKRFAPLIVASMADGGGASGSRGGGAATLKRSQMTPAQKREFIEKNGQESFLKLPKE